jgi:hypothetical protein
VPELKLTALSHGAGCACKLSPAELHPLLREMPLPSDPALLVGLDTADDAAVYRVSDDLAIVTSVDFFTPIVDDPLEFGRIAAANALSDVYAMGGTPITALNLVAYSLDALGPEPLREILRAAAQRNPSEAEDPVAIVSVMSGKIAQRATKAWELAGLQRITLHECRHTYASFLMAAGYTLKELMEYMGHSDLQMVQRYTKLLPQPEERDPAERLNAYLAKRRRGHADSDAK